MEILFLTICVAVIAILFALSIGVWLSDIRKQMRELNAFVTGKFAPEIVEYEAPDGVELKKAYPGDACYDLYTSGDFTLTRKRSVIPTGLRISLPMGWSATIRPRSGITAKGVPAVRTTTDGKTEPCWVYGTAEIGTIDAGYRGEIQIIFNSDLNPAKSKAKYTIPSGTKLAQLYIQRDDRTAMIKVDNIQNDTERAAKGFGSSGF